MATVRAKAKVKKKAPRRPKVGVRTRTAKGPVVRRKAAQPRKAAASPVDAALRLAGVGSAAVLKATGRAWEDWLKVLDRAGARTMPHREIAQLLARRFEVPGWWSQMVTVGYEQARGRRKPREKADGFSANASRTVGVPVSALYGAWSHPAQRAAWLPNAPLEIRRETDGKSMRITWTLGGSDVDVGFFAKGAGKSVVQVSHTKLEDEAAAAVQKVYWTEALARLKALLER